MPKNMVWAKLTISLLLSLLIGLFSLRVKAIFYAMITLAVASAFQTLASQLSEVTGGEDGLSFKPPRWLSPAFEPFDAPVLGLSIDGKIFSAAPRPIATAPQPAPSRVLATATP